MKKIIIIAAVALVLFSSCKVHVQVEMSKNIAYKGLVVYGATTDNCISKYLLGLDNILKGEEVANAPLEKKDSLEDFYFPDYKVRSDEDSIYLRPFAVISKDNDIPFNKTGSIRYYKMSNFTLRAECVTENEYILSSIPLGYKAPVTSLNVKVSQNNVFGQNTYNSVYSYAVTGEGEYSEYLGTYASSYYDGDYLKYSIFSDNVQYRVKFRVNEPLLACLTPNVFSITYGAFKYYEGSLNMYVSGTSLGNNVDIINSFLRLSSDGNYVIATVHYNDEVGTFTLQ